MTTANELILSALKGINAYAPGQSLAAEDANDSLLTLNDLLDQWSTDSASIYASDADVFTFVPGQYIYSIGNYDGGTFAGTVTTGSATITAALVPSDMKIGGDLTGTGIPAGATVLAFNAGAGTVTMSTVGVAAPGTPQQISYTIPGDFKVTRPLRVTNAFTRIYTQASGLDYPIDIVDQARYINIGFKAIPAPWPIVVWYNPTFPLGTLSFYQNPSSAGELHLFSDNIFTNFTSLTQNVNFPPGYKMAIKRGLMRQLAPEYGKEWSPLQEKLYKESYDYIKSLNQVPAVVSNYDPELMQGNATDAGWILYGGFR